MNILFLNSIDVATYGGMEEWIRLVAMGLKKRGHTVTVCGRPRSEFLRRLRGSLPDEDLCPVAVSADFHPGTIAHIRRLIQERRIDVVITNFNKDIRLGGLAARWTGKAKVIWSAGLDITRDKWVHRILTPRLLDGIIVPSAALKRQITRHGYLPPEMVEVIPIGLKDTKAHPELDRRFELRERFGFTLDHVVAVTSGRFVEQKGHRYLLDAVPYIVAEHPEIRFLLLGDGPLRESLEAQIARLDISEYVALAGMLDSVDEVLAGADLMIHPSVEEPFGIAILEGMRAGLPVVASDVGGIPEVVCTDTSALLVPPREPKELARAVKHLLDWPDLMRYLGEGGRNRWEKLFNYETMIDRVEANLARVRGQEEVHGPA
ncbi:MAG: glycosyltransferase family 1 protein [Candidatus Zixiibacteriota bacterium]|nr:MAG: glycosyltransferase family 1 protein [candidate division Zixibacteria bacterium]